MIAFASRSRTEEDHAWWSDNNLWFDGAYTDPGTVDASLFDRSAHNLISCRFKEDAAEALVVRVGGYLRLLDRYGVRWVELHSADPGRVVYEDDVQIVVCSDP